MVTSWFVQVFSVYWELSDFVAVREVVGAVLSTLNSTGVENPIFPTLSFAAAQYQ